MTTIALSRQPRLLTGWLAVPSSALSLAAGVPRPHRWVRPHGVQAGPLRAPAPRWRAQQHSRHYALRASASAHEEGLGQELCGRPARVAAITDPHLHFWAPSTHAWLRAVLPGGEAHDGPYGRFAPIARPYTPAMHCAHLAPFAPLTKTVYIQANMHATTGSPVAETAYMQGLADATGHPHGIISWAPLDKPEEAGAVLDQHAKFANFRGIRFMLDFHPSRPELCQADSGAYMADGGFLRGLRHLEERGLIFELQLCAVQLKEAAVLAAKLPKLQIVLNNAGFPLKGEFDSWRAGLAKLAANPNVACKIGGLGAYDGGFDLEAARPHVLACFELFGLERCMFSSNLPVDLVDWPHGPPSARWDTYLAISKGAGLTPAQLGAVFSDNAVRIYNI